MRFSAWGLVSLTDSSARVSRVLRVMKISNFVLSCAVMRCNCIAGSPSRLMIPMTLYVLSFFTSSCTRWRFAGAARAFGVLMLFPPLLWLLARPLLA